MTARAFVLGWPIEHTRSPAIQNAAFAAASVDAEMVPLAVTSEDLASTVRSLVEQRMLGASITIPHKLTIAALCDELSPEAKAIGAVNCLQLTDAGLVGHNTDCAGFLDGLVGAGFELRGKRVVLLGAGGGARAVAYGVRGGRAIEVVARRSSEVAWATAWPWSEDNLRDCFARADLVVDCTSAGLDAAADVAFTDGLPLDALRPTAWVATLVYHRQTELLQRAAARAHSTLDGKPMLVHQGARAFSLWTGLPAPVDVMTRALDDSLAR
jgi:shikimate dehydrogenase